LLTSVPSTAEWRHSSNSNPPIAEIVQGSALDAVGGDGMPDAQGQGFAKKHGFIRQACQVSDKT
jgi:hypothetical protein